MRLNIYNQTKPAPTAGTKISITRGTDDTRYRELIENSSLPVIVTTYRSGKATVDDTKVLDDGFKTCVADVAGGLPATGSANAGHSTNLTGRQHRRATQSVEARTL